VDATGRQLGGDRGDVARRGVDDHAHVGLTRADVREGMHVQELGRERRHLVGGHHPRAHPEQQHELGRGRYSP